MSYWQNKDQFGFDRKPVSGQNISTYIKSRERRVHDEKLGNGPKESEKPDVQSGKARSGQGTANKPRPKRVPETG